MKEKLKNIKNIFGVISIFFVIILFVILVFENKKYTKNLEKDITKKEEMKKEKKEENKPNNIYSAGQIQKIISGKEEYSGEKLVFLTFDDGPFNDSTNKILDVLKEKKVNATFFLQGKNVKDETSDVLKRIVSEKNGIGMHSFDHDYKRLYPEKVGDATVIVDEMKKTDTALKKQLGEEFKSSTWRYPGGHMSWKGLEEADKLMADAGVTWIDWNVLNGDAEPSSTRPKTVDEMIDKLDNSMENTPVKDVAVVLMHDGKSKELTVEALPKIIDYYKEKNYKFCIFN
ncbi:polysaccharide deacetylase family protein [Miniphocaeibacter halophilus]|uniref:Polysaccharide deacetylase n=1 Tax=Miniphocaeibacter halophilus TaxID=2931922 RepID=A0AC61MPE1_9FIRM|nr:polysaccharide deacetylase family protein [Miniphocaeibacter halophilus]QQK07341.1 polysaccharide deacetylase [Miniphocaeibacter halophilus]